MIYISPSHNEFKKIQIYCINGKVYALEFYIVYPINGRI